MPILRTEVARLKNGKQETVEENINFYWGVSLEKSLLSMLFAVYMKREDAGDKTREFFSQFFRVNPSLAHVIKGLED